MKVFVIGGAVSRPNDQKYKAQTVLLRKSMQEVGRTLICRGHDLLICSPHRGSADIEAFRGATKAFTTHKRSCVEFHAPDLEDTQRELNLLIRSLPQDRIKRFIHPVSADDRGTPNLMYSWLLSQISALVRCQVVLALGGRTDGSASLLLPIAEAQQKQILPLTFLGGAAIQSFERQRNVLASRLADKIIFLHDKNRVAEAVKLTLLDLKDQRPRRRCPEGQGIRRLLPSISELIVDEFLRRSITGSGVLVLKANLD